MKFVCDKNILHGSVTSAITAVSKKSAVQFIDGLLLIADAESGTLVICGYDLEKGVQAMISGDNLKIEESGKVIINAEKFSSIIKNMPDGNISVTVDSNFIMSIKNNKAQFSISGLDGEKFPSMPVLKGEKDLKIPRKTLKEMITSTLFSVATGTIPRASLGGELFEIKNKRLKMVSCDGNRLSLRSNSDTLPTNEENDLSFIVPHKSLSELQKLISDSEEAAKIELTPKHVIVSFDNIIFFSRLIEETYIDYNNVIQISPKTTVVVNTRRITESLERSAVLTDNKQSTNITLNFKKEEQNIENREEAGILQITSESSSGKTFDELSVDIYGDDIEIGANQRYLLEALKVVKEEMVMILLDNPLKPLIILPYNKETGDKSANFDNSKFIYLVVPMRLKKSTPAKSKEAS